jgi:hypothetical protein
MRNKKLHNVFAVNKEKHISSVHVSRIQKGIVPTEGKLTTSLSSYLVQYANLIALPADKDSDK